MPWLALEALTYSSLSLALSPLTSLTALLGNYVLCDFPKQRLQSRKLSGVATRSVVKLRAPPPRFATTAYVLVALRTVQEVRVPFPPAYRVRSQYAYQVKRRMTPVCTLPRFALANVELLYRAFGPRTADNKTRYEPGKGSRKGMMEAADIS